MSDIDDFLSSKAPTQDGAVAAKPKSDIDSFLGSPSGDDSNLARGFKTAMRQVPQTFGGAAALVGDAVGSKGLRDWGMDVYKGQADKIQELSRDSDSFTNVLKGDANLSDWAGYGAGYVGGQALQSLATGGVGGFIGKKAAEIGARKLVEEGVKRGAEEAAKQQAKQQVRKGIERGAGAGLFGSNLMQEAGSIYPEAVEQAREDGRLQEDGGLSGGDLARVGGSAVGAAALDTLMEAKIAKGIMGGGASADPSLVKRVLKEGAKGAGREALTEGAQTGIERWGAQQSLGDKEAIQDYIDSAALGALGGGLGGAPAGLHTPRQARGFKPEGEPAIDDAGAPGAAESDLSAGGGFADQLARDSQNAPAPSLDPAALAANGVTLPTPAPVLDTARLNAEVAKPTPSEAMGLRHGPDALVLENAAALAVDSGASPVANAAAMADSDGVLPEAAAQDATTASDNADLSAWSDADLSTAFQNAQQKEIRQQLAQELQHRREVREQQALQQEMDAEQSALDMPDAPDAAFANVREDAGAPNLQDGPSHSVADGVADKGRQPTVSQQPKEASSGTQAQETQQAGAGQQAARAGQAVVADPGVVQAPAIAPEFTTVKTVHGDSVTVPEAAPQTQVQGQAPDNTIDALRQQLRAVEAKIIEAAPAAMGQGGGDIDAAMKSRKVPVTLKAQRKKLKEQIQQAQSADGSQSNQPQAQTQQAQAAIDNVASTGQQATHQDPGETPEVATAAVVAQSVKTAARNEGDKPSAMRKWLVDEVDAAIAKAQAPDAAKMQALEKANSAYAKAVDLNQRGRHANALREAAQAIGYVTFDVPGDGKFKVLNTPEGLQAFRKKVLASPGFKDSGQDQDPRVRDGDYSGRNGSASVAEAIKNFLSDGDVRGALEFAQVKGVEFTPVAPQMRVPSKGGKARHIPASVTSKPAGVADGLTQIEREQLNQYLTAQGAQEQAGDAPVVASKFPKTDIRVGDTVRHNGNDYVVDGGVAGGISATRRVAEHGSGVTQDETIVLRGDDAVRAWREANVSAPETGQQGETPVKPVTAAAPAPKKPRGILAKKAEAEEKARAEYFTPGNVVAGYGGAHVRVVSYQPSDADGRWSVTVRAVRKEGDAWVDVPGERERNHATQPDARELKAGPVGRMPSGDAAKVQAQEASTAAPKKAMSPEERLAALVKAFNDTPEYLPLSGDVRVAKIETETLGVKGAGWYVVRDGKKISPQFSTKQQATAYMDGLTGEPNPERERLRHEIAAAAKQAAQKTTADHESGPFGPILTQYRHDAQGAIKALTELQDGEAVAALHHPEVGDIDLVWGEAGTGNKNGYGLAKLDKYHPEVLGDLQGFLSRLSVDPKRSGKNRIRLVDATGEAAISLDWKGDRKVWLLTAYEKSADAGTTMNTASDDAKGDTTRLDDGADVSVPVNAPQGKLTTAEAKSLMAWESIGTKDGVQTHILTFYESHADKDALRGRMTIAKVTKGDRSASNWMVDGDDKPLAVLGMAKKRAEDAGMAKLVADGYVGEAPTTGPKPARITPDIAANMKAGDVVVDEDGKEYRTHAARHKWLEAHPIENGKAKVSADTLVTFHLDPQTASGYPERSHKAVFLKEEAAENNPLADYNALAQEYGFEVRPDGAIGSDGKFPGPKMKVKGGRLRIESGSGDLLASYASPAPQSLGKFLESFWYAQNKAPVDGAGKTAEPASDRDHFTLERLNRETDAMEPVTFERGEYVRYRVGSEDHFGEIDGISHARGEFSVDGLWYAFGFANKAERPTTPARSGVAPLSSVIDKMNAKHGAGLTDADRVPPTSLVDAHEATMQAVREGKATPEQFKASFEAVLAKADAIRAELSAKTKAQLLVFGGPQVQWRHANSTKPDIVDAVYHEMLRDYALGETITHGLARDSYQNAVRRMVEATDADKLAQFVKERETELQEVKARGEARAQALESPQSLNDYRQFVAHHMQTHGETRMQAFMRLTPQQRVRYDALEAEGTKAQREQAKATAKTAVAAAGQAVAGEVIATKHTKLGHDLFVVQLAERVSREDYETLNASARRMGGSYSSYRGGGAVPGFQFRTREAAEAFQKLVGGDTQDAKAVADARRDAFEDDRSQSGIERLRAMAQALDERADASLGQERKANTARRARFAASAEAAARADKALAATMRNLAAAIEAGKAKFLDAVRQKVQVQALGQYLRSAKDAQVRAKYANYGDQQEHLRDPVDAETVDHAEFPSYTAMRSDLASVARQMLEVDGLKKLGARLGKVADDVTPAYTEWAKQNLTAVSQFARGDQLADFASREDAERALRRSGMTGRAIVLPVKRGHNRIVLAPGEAMRLGLWTGDGDKRITLSSDFGRELVEALGRRAGGAIKLPWTLESALEKRKRLESMGIFTAAEFRSALREFADVEQGVAMPDKVKELERSMVGRRADGLDFFPTSAAVVDDMLAAAEIEPGMAVLEPSAGMGHIADAIRDDAGVTPDVVELSGERRELLEAKGHRLVGEDFMAMQRGEGYDRIIMNPPFSKGRDIAHVRHAYSLLKPGGRLVAIMGEGAFFQSNKNADGFRQWLDELGASSERLPEGSFTDPSLPVNTGANARMVVIDKPAVGLPANDGARTANSAIRAVGDAAPAEASRVQAAIEGKGLIDAARFLTQSSNQAHAEVAQKVLEKLLRLEDAGVELKLNIVHRGEMAPAAMANSRGYTETGFDSRGRDIVVWLNGADVTGKVGVEEEVLLHELVHAATAGMVFYGTSKPNSLAGKHVRDLSAVTDAIAAHITRRFKDADAGNTTLTEFERDMRTGANNAFRNDDEVLAWALTNAEAQQYLEGIPYKSESLWSAFVGAVRRLLGLQAQNDTALSEVLRVADRLMTDDAPDAGRAAFWHKRGLPMVTQQGRGSLVFQGAPVQPKLDDDGLAGMSRAVASAMRELSQPRPVDSAVMGMVREGRSAREVLGLIAGASRSRFNRQVARLLLKTGINPSMHLDNTDMGGEQGYRFLAKYSRANDAITMTDGALRQAEQIVLHELIHAATLRALDRKGLHSLQMRRLYEHVKRHGGAAGQYGMKNVGEFVAEVFTNPKFQRALQAMDAPSGGTLKTAWDSFVRILRSILGLSNDAHSALSQALEIGVAVMREDMALRKEGVAGSGTAAMMASSRDSGDTESQRQFRETERAYGGRDGYQKAKDAGKTKLTYGQWVQVRTPNFIRWFGDHVIASAVPQRQASNFDQAREQAKAFQGKPLTNPASGIVATVSRNNLDKMLSEKAVDKSAAPALHSVAVANLDGLFERAILGWSKPDANGDPNIRAIHRFFAPLMVDGQARLVKMTVKETGIASDPNPLYTVEAVEFNEKSPAAQWVAASLAADGLELTSIRSAGDVQSLAQRVQDFNPDAVSKVVDTETGETLVVYHGTKADFDAFDIDTAPWNALRRLAAAVVPGFSSERAGERRAAFFTSSASGASTYATLDRTWGDAPNVMPVYLRIERPLVVDGARRMATTPSGEVVSVGEGASPNVLIDLAREHGADGVVIKDIEDAATGEAGADMYLAFADTQIKSANGNNGAFDPQDPDISHFGVDDITRMKSDALGRIDAAMKHPGTVSLWDKTVGTMRNLAERNPLFKPVYEAAQRFIDDVAMLANDAADMAPRVLPRVDTWRDLAKRPINAADNKAVAKPLFEGTLIWARDEQGKPTLVRDLEGRYASLSTDEKARKMLDAKKIDPGVLRMWQGLPKEQFDTLIESRFKSQMLKPGVVWSDKELASIFKMTPNQISLYRETRKAIDRSIDMTARADMLRALGTEFADMRDVVLEQDSLGDAMELVISELQEQAKASPDDSDRLMQLHNQVVDRATKARDLMDAGYAPLSRFGRYTVDVVDASGERQYFGMYESKADSNRAKLQLQAAFPGATVTQGTMSNEAFKLFSGITPESLELFGNMLGLDEEGGHARDRAFQEYLKLTKNNHSAIKRLIHRQGIAGFSEDVGRVLASFVYSNARQAAGGLNAGTMDRAVNAIPKSEGELKDVAMGLRGYIQDPQEEGQAVRGMLFAQYLGGSVASAFVNMTQPFAVTMPWLSQFGGIRGASAKLAQALKDMGTKGFKYEAELAQALKHAEDDGVVSPQEIHQLMAQARGSGSLRSGDGTRVGEAKAAASNAWERTKVAWGQPFALAEQFNRRLTFIAAYRIAKERKMADPAQFARRAVEETQFVYSKANKMRWGRGAIGGALMTFKSYSIQYLELLHRMWTQGGPQGKKAVGFAMVTLLLMGGAGGLPFMEDLEDLIDGIAQLMGINISSKQKRQEFLRSVVGKGLADFMEQGVSGLPGAPVDVSGRLGLGNLIPGTGLLMNKQNRERDLLELAGPAGDLLKRGFTGGRKFLTGDVGGAAMEVAPTAVRNAAKGIDMATSGMYKDARGYKIIDTTLDEALAKFAGFQPKSVAEVQEANSFMMRSKSFYQQVSAEIKAQWADALFRKDDKAVQRVRERLAKWNRDNPDQPIIVKMPDVWKRVREMGKDRTERIAATAPRALRQQMREMAAQAM